MHDGGKIVIHDDLHTGEGGGTHHVGGLLGHLGAGDAHGHPDVCPLQCRRVVDSIACDCHNVAGPLVALHNEQLLLGTRPGEGDLRVGGDQLVEHVVGPVRHDVARHTGGDALLELGGHRRLIPIDDGAGGEDADLVEEVDVRGEHLLGDGLGRDGVVAGHHDHLDPSTPAVRHSVGDCGFGRVDHAAEKRLRGELCHLIRPTKQSPVRGKLGSSSSVENLKSVGKWAGSRSWSTKPRTLSPMLASSSQAAAKSAFTSADIGTFFPSSRIVSHLAWRRGDGGN